MNPVGRGVRSAAPDKPSRFIRVMILPRELQGKKLNSICER